MQQRVVFLMTTHDQVEQCNSSIKALGVACEAAGLMATVYLANSGSKKVFLSQEVQNLNLLEFKTDSSTYWAEGMRQAWERLNDNNPSFDYLIWLNADTYIYEESLQYMIGFFQEIKGAAILTGACEDSQGAISYGGYLRSSALFPLHFTPLPKSDSLQLCDAFNGNFVMMGRETAILLDGFSRGYSHLRADLAFGLRARGFGVSLFVAPGTLARCELNDTYQNYRSLKYLGLIDRLRALGNPKFGPYSEHFKFSLRYGGLLGPLYALAPIVRAIFAK